jgi:hypothetical protein
MRDITRYLAWAVAGVVSAIALVACGGGTTGPSTIDVEGTVFGRFGLGLAGLSVAIGDAAPATTDEGGGFLIEGVTPPYDLVVYDPVEAWAHVFAGLSTEAPEVLPFGGLDEGGTLVSYGASVAGDLSEVVAAGHAAVVCVESAERRVSSCTGVDAGFSDYELDPMWLDSTTVNATVRAIVYEVDGNGTSTGVASMGTADVALADGDVVVALDVAMEPVDQGTVDLTIVVPDSWAFDGFMMSTRFPDRHKTTLVPGGTPPTFSFEVAVADVAGADHSVFARATSGDAQSWAWRAGLDAAGQPEILTLPTPVAKIQPADGAVDVGAGATFEVVPRPGSGFLHVLDPVVPDAGPDVAVSTVEPSLDLPDLASLDPALALPAAEAYEWVVATAGGMGDANDLATGGGILAPYAALELAYDGFFGAEPATSGSFAIGSVSTFTFE